MAVACYSDTPAEPRAILQIAHGMGEHAQRYGEVASKLAASGFAVYTNDHRGHGETGKSSLGYMGPDGWNRLLADAYELNRLAVSRHPGVPVVLLGHSMGSMMAQQYITRYGMSIDALVLSGSPWFKAKSINPIPGWILAFETWRLGRSGASGLMQKLLFGSANKPFEHPLPTGAPTGFEWLSRDNEAVRAYVDDPWCGFVVATGSLVELYAGAAQTQDPENIARIPKILPIYVFSGSEDPVHGGRLDLQRMIDAYRLAGIADIDVKWYDGGRHEMFNEINADEVVADLLGWLDKTLSPG